MEAAFPIVEENRRNINCVWRRGYPPVARAFRDGRYRLSPSERRELWIERLEHLHNPLFPNEMPSDGPTLRNAY
jgi:hypothetical protein